MSRQEDFFNEATKQIRDSYVFQSEETYSDDDVRDIATSLAEYGYQYALQHPHWIPVEERLPEEQGKYMFRLSNGDMYYETYYPELKLLDNVTHWMPIVPPRKEEKK